MWRDVRANIYDEILSIAKEWEFEITVPHKTKRQVHQENYPSNSPIDYYRQSVYIPIIEDVTEDLKNRFPRETINLYYLSVLFPDSATFNHEESMRRAAFTLAQKYSFIFKDSTNIIKRKIIFELNLWRVKWEAEKLDSSISALELLIFCYSDVFPTLHILLTILKTFPSCVASAERSFSTIRRLKTWLRSVISKDRLIGLALLNIHYDIIIDTNANIDRYAKTRKHRLEFIICNVGGARNPLVKVLLPKIKPHHPRHEKPRDSHLPTKSPPSLWLNSRWEGQSDGNNYEISRTTLVVTVMSLGTHEDNYGGTWK